MKAALLIILLASVNTALAADFQKGDSATFCGVDESQMEFAKQWMNSQLALPSVTIDGKTMAKPYTVTAATMTSYKPFGHDTFFNYCVVLKKD